MEALLFMFNSLAIVLMVFMGLRDDRRAPGVAHTSIFRTRDPAAPPPPQAAQIVDREDSGWAAWDRAGKEPTP